MYCTKRLTQSIRENKPIVFMKLGDGEYNCATYAHGKNCDLDDYSAKKGVAIVQALSYLTENTEHSYFGLWWNTETKSYWEEQTEKSIQWVNYHSIIIDDNDMNLKNEILYDKIELLKTIKNSSLKKIYVCNELLIKVKQLLNIDICINVSIFNWFETEFERVIQEVKEHYDENGTVCMISAGMAAKPLIAELVKCFPKGIFLDFGSALDLICTAHNTRGWSFTYDEIKDILKDLLPKNWDDPKYTILHEKAKQHLGTHLHTK